MRILHVIASVRPQGGGPIEGVKQLASVVTALGHEVEIASLDSPDIDAASCPLPLYALGPGKLKYGYSSRFASWLRGNAQAYDVIIVRGIWQFHSLATWRAVRRSKTPYVVFTDGMLDPWFKNTYPLKHLKKRLYWPWAEYRVLRDAGAVLFTSEEERRLARQSFSRYSAREKVVGQGSIHPTGDAGAQLAAWFSRFPHLRGKRLVLFLGRIHPKKGCDLAIRAFARVLASQPDWRLVMAGPDQVGIRRALERLAADLNISDKVTWTDMITGEVKQGALRSAEVFLLPSHQENFGIAVAEALAYGVPALISNKINIWREVEQDGGGLVAEDDLEGTSSLLQKWASLPDSQKALMREAAKKCFDTRFEIHRAAGNLLSTLTAVVEEHRLSHEYGADAEAGRLRGAWR